MFVLYISMWYTVYIHPYIHPYIHTYIYINIIYYILYIIYGGICSSIKSIIKCDALRRVAGAFAHHYGEAPWKSHQLSMLVPKQPSAMSEVFQVRRGKEGATSPESSFSHSPAHRKE